MSRDQTARLWDGASGGQQKSFTASGEPLFAAALTADGKRVAAGGANGVVRIWDAANGRLLLLGLMADAAGELILATPEGYVQAGPATLSALTWRVGSETVPSDPFSSLVKPDEIQKALRGEPVTPVKISVAK